MSKLTGEEIIEKIKASELTQHDFYEGYVENLGLGKVKTADSYGGEGQGDDYWAVHHFVDHDVYIKISGWYASYDGADFDGWNSLKVVAPKEKTITIYE